MPPPLPHPLLELLLLHFGDNPPKWLLTLRFVRPAPPGRHGLVLEGKYASHHLAQEVSVFVFFRNLALRIRSEFPFFDACADAYKLPVVFSFQGQEAKQLEVHPK